MKRKYRKIPKIKDGNLWSAAAHNEFIGKNFEAGIPAMMGKINDLVVGAGFQEAARIELLTNYAKLFVNEKSQGEISWETQPLGIAFGSYRGAQVIPPSVVSGGLELSAIHYDNLGIIEAETLVRNRFVLPVEFMGIIMVHCTTESCATTNAVYQLGVRFGEAEERWTSFPSLAGQPLGLFYSDSYFNLTGSPVEIQVVGRHTESTSRAYRDLFLFILRV